MPESWTCAEVLTGGSWVVTTKKIWLQDQHECSCAVIPWSERQDGWVYCNNSRSLFHHCLTGDDVLKLLEDESFEAESSSDSDESDDYICDLSDSDDGWDSDHLNSQLNHGDLGVVDDGGMSSPSPPSSLSRFGSAWGGNKWLLTVYVYLILCYSHRQESGPRD